MRELGVSSNQCPMIRGNQKWPEAIRGDQRRPEATRNRVTSLLQYVLRGRLIRPSVCPPTCGAPEWQPVVHGSVLSCWDQWAWAEKSRKMSGPKRSQLFTIVCTKRKTFCRAWVPFTRSAPEWQPVLYGRRPEATREDQTRPEVRRSDQRQPEATRGDQKQSEATKGKQSRPETTRGAKDH